VRTLRTLYRGVRLTEPPDTLKRYGMRYYWRGTDDAVSAIFEALERTHSISKLGRTPLLRMLVTEAARPKRIQIWGTEVKENAQSYARGTPELIFLTLDAAKVPLDVRRRFIEQYYGKPYVVEFTDGKHQSKLRAINEACGNFIEAERIISVEPVEVNTPDPYMKFFSSSMPRPESSQEG